MAPFRWLAQLNIVASPAVPSPPDINGPPRPNLPFRACATSGSQATSPWAVTALSNTLACPSAVVYPALVIGGNNTRKLLAAHGSAE